MVLENGEIKVNNETRIVTTHFRFCDQFNGLLGSCGPSHVICDTRKLMVWASLDGTHNDVLFFS